MRWANLGILIAFFFTAMHVVVDHGAGRQTPFAFLPHPCLSHVHSDDQQTTAYHPDDHESASPGEQHPEHQADTHSHGEWYAPTRLQSMLPLTLMVVDASVFVAPSLMTRTAFLDVQRSAPPPCSIPIYLRCSAFLI